MNNIFLEYGKNYNIPVYLQIDGLTNRFVEGSIIIKNKYVPRLLVNIYNDDDIIDYNKEIKIDLIKCYPKESGKHILLINCVIKNIHSFSGAKRSFNIYFDYILNGCEKIKSKKDLTFSIITFSFENLYKWILPYDKKNKMQEVLLNTKIDGINNKTGIFKLTKTFYTVQSNSQDKRLHSEEHDVKLEIKLINGKFSLKEISVLIRDLEAFLTCFVGKSCFCLDTTLKNKRGRTKYFYVYNFLDAMHQSEPKFKLTHPIYSLFPFVLSFNNEFRTAINTYFQNREKLNNIMYKISSVLLYNNRFLYDIEFHYVCTLIETCFRNLIYDKKKHNKTVNYKKIEEKLDDVFDDKDILKSFMNSISRFHKPNFGKKIKELVNFQYEECKIVNFKSGEIQFIKENRNKISHGDVLIMSKKYNHQTVLEKLIILIFYSIWKTLGLTANTIKQNIIKSSSTFLSSISTEDIEYEESEKISISNKEFGKLKNLQYIYCLVIEKHENKYIINENYTRFINKDIYQINYYSYIYNYLKCYYNLDYVNNIDDKNYLYLINNSNPEEKKKINTSLIVSVNSFNKKKLYKLNDSLIPDKVYEYSRKNNLSILRAYREVKKLTIKKLSKKTGFSDSTIIAYEKKDEIKNKETYRKILKVLGTNLFAEDKPL